MRQQRKNKGETLVETIVSFVVVLLTLAMVTSIVRLSITLNNRAMEKAAALEEATTAIENGPGAAIFESGNMILIMPGEGDDDDIHIPYRLYRDDEDLIRFFTASAEGGGGG